jgi:hypothetical protein
MKHSIQEIRFDIEAIEADETLCCEENLVARTKAIDRLELLVFARIEHLLHRGGPAQELAALDRRAEQVKGRLEAVDERLARGLRERIRSGRYDRAELKRQFRRYVDESRLGTPGDFGYDSLDVLVSGLLRVGVAPRETREREPEMVFYQPTPARTVLQLVEEAPVTGQDVFYDLGSGLGRVPILVHLLCGSRAKGIEFEPAYVRYAERCARALNLPVEFINADAREADYADGSVFFLYTPCRGRMLQEVISRLKAVSRDREIRVCTYGPCTMEVGQQEWLKRANRGALSAHGLAVFASAGRPALESV